MEIPKFSEYRDEIDPKAWLSINQGLKNGGNEYNSRLSK